MTRISKLKLVLIVMSAIVLTLMLTACDSDEPQQRLPRRHTFSPGATFATNINYTDPRRVLRCSVVFEIIDEQAGEELVYFEDTIRNAVLAIMGELTMEEVTVNKDLEDIAARMVTRVNEAIGSNVSLIIGASFTEFVLT